MDVWEMVDAERGALNAKLATLSDADWASESLASGWTVTTVAGHLLSICTMSVPAFLAGMVKARFNFEKFGGTRARACINHKQPAEILNALQQIATARGKPPGPKTTVLGEVLIHGEDIVRAVTGSWGEHPIEHVETVADFYKRNRFPMKVKTRIAGVTLRMTDCEWSYGSGPEVSGSGIAILMAMAGRKIALDDLNGEGVAVLAGRA